MTHKKSNSPDASTKQDDVYFAAVEQGAHDAGKPVEPKEGEGFHSGRKLPKAEVVAVVSNETNKGKAIELAKKQNTMSPDGQLAQLPAGGSHKSTTSSRN